MPVSSSIIASLLGSRDRTVVISVIAVIAVVVIAVAVTIVRRRSSPSSSSPSSPIDWEIGGIQAPAKRYPYIAQIIVNKTGGVYGFCTGFLITPWIVLTAAHCFFEKTSVTPKQIEVYVGQGIDQWYEHRIQGPDDKTGLIKRGASDIVWAAPPSGVQAKFIKTTNDFAFVILDQPIIHVTPVKVAGLTAPGIVLKPGVSVTSIGYGVDQLYSGNKAKATTSTQTYRSLGNGVFSGIPKFLMQNTFGITSLTGPYIVVLNATESGCHGDSGGPLIVKGATSADDIVVGIVNNTTCVSFLASKLKKQNSTWLRTDSIAKTYPQLLQRTTHRRFAWSCVDSKTLASRGVVNVAWGKGPGGYTTVDDATWACNAFRPSCGGKCMAYI